MVLLCAGAEAQPSVTAKSKPQPVPITRSAPMVKPEVYRVPPEMTGGDARPFATEFLRHAAEEAAPADGKKAGAYGATVIPQHLICSFCEKLTAR
jgi:hypothetical protein